ncbi:hypothetical protein AVU39_gp41 [Sulfolobus monocaudavirus SMV2]|uniref:hypothetical protein n=1 Tax=Sulfolobus monocaudavirus SMV2 TaxID=1580591 RepID=UPI0006D308B8|nr:hypothetical protein AVU39_gp41 [Sulfolobus monocaudavirus SMV2]AIZ11375.1 hypothetical protein [Sulfolobus monocaudavirus SMV2]
MAEVGIKLGGVDPNELKIVVNNLGKRVAIFALNSENKPVVVYFGDIPHSAFPLILASLHLYKDRKGNKCVVFCSLVIDNDGSYFPIDLKIPREKLASLSSEYMIFDFCDRIEKIENGNVICNERRALLVINTFSRDFINKLIEEMKNPGNEDEAYEEYEKEYEYPICLNPVR